MQFLCREMTKALNSKYSPPSRNSLSNHLIPAWYNVEKRNVKSVLEQVSKVATITDGWTSICQDDYITVTAHYINEGKMNQKVLKAKAVYKALTGSVVAQEIGDIFDEFGIRDKVTAVTVDNASNMDEAVKKLQLMKIGCFTHTLSLGAQSLYAVTSVVFEA